MLKGGVRGIEWKEQTSTVKEHYLTIIRSPHRPLEGVNGSCTRTSPVLSVNISDLRTG